MSPYPDNVDPTADYCPWNQFDGYGDEPEFDPLRPVFEMPAHATSDENDLPF